MRIFPSHRGATLRSYISPMLPAALREWLRKRLKGNIDWGHLRRVVPISRDLYARGRPIDRFYIENFLAENSVDIAGSVLEVKDNAYTRRFGGPRVTRSDVLDIDAKNPNATIILDLNAASKLPTEAFDCIILSQTLQFIHDVPAALRELHRALKRGGVLLATLPGITPLSEPGLSWCWSFTSFSTERLLELSFPQGQLSVQTHGNVLSATALLHGLAVDDLRPDELYARDPHFPVLITARAVKFDGRL